MAETKVEIGKTGALRGDVGRVAHGRSEGERSDIEDVCSRSRE